MGTREEMTDWYEILEVRPDAGQAEIRKAYLEKARQVHPDRHSVSEKDRDRSWRDANARAAEVNRAYEVLGDEELRRQYDATRRRDARPSDAEPAQPRRAQEERRATGKELRPDGTGGWAFFDELLERALRRFAPWTAPGRSGETRCSRGKRGDADQPVILYLI